MKKKIFISLFLFFSLLFFISNLSAQHHLNAEEDHSLDEVAQILTKTYSESARWEAFLQAKQAQLSAPMPVLMPDWKTLGPNTLNQLSGRMLCLTIDPSDHQRLYAGAGSGGLWRSNNGGDSWEALTNDLPSFHVSAVAVNPDNPQEILIGTGIGKIPTTTLKPGVGVLRSLDGGNTWDMTSYNYQLSDNQSVDEIIWDEVAQGKVFLATTNGLYESTDGGQNWSTILPNVRVYDFALNRQNPSTMYAAVQNIGIRRSTDGGQTWTTLNTGIPSGAQAFRSALSICESDPDILYAILVSGSNSGTLGVYRSQDGGNTWTTLNNAPAVHCQPGNPNNCAGWIFNTIGVAPDNPDIVLIGGVQFWRTENGGQNWTWLDYASNGTSGTNDGLTYVDHWDVEFDLEDPSTVYVCNDGGVQKSTDYGQWWERKSNDLTAAQVYTIDTDPNNANFLIGGFHDHGLQRLDHSNDNLMWTRWSLNDGVKTIIDYTNPNIIYGNIQNGTPYKSTTGGAGITTTFPINNGITEAGPWETPLIMHPTNPNKLYTASNARIYRTAGGGNIWVAAGNIPSVQTLAINPLNPDTLFAHAFSGGAWALWRSLDGTTTWQSINDPSIPSWGVSALESSPHQAETIYATRNSANPNNDHVKVSYDNGNTWIDITNNLPDIRVNDILVSPLSPDHLYLATDLGVYVSTNAGESWMEFNNNLPLIYTRDIDFSPADSTIRIATMGRGIWKTAALLPEPNAVFDTNDWTKQIDFQVFPNPASKFVTVQFNLPYRQKIKLECLDVKGQQLKIIQEGWLEMGEHKKEFYLEDTLSDGVYFLRLTLGQWAVHQKVIIKR